MAASSVATRISTLPPSLMSVPRPAMLVAMVTAPGYAGLRDDLGFLLVIARIEHVVRDVHAFFSMPASTSDFSIEVVPTSTG